jgi:hypothetical protein
MVAATLRQWTGTGPVLHTAKVLDMTVSKPPPTLPQQTTHHGMGSVCQFTQLSNALRAQETVLP